MPNSYLYMILKALWVLVRYVRIMSGNDKFIGEATTVMMQLGSCMDDMRRQDASLKLFER